MTSEGTEKSKRTMVVCKGDESVDERVVKCRKRQRKVKWDVTVKVLKIWMKRVTGHNCEASERTKTSVTARDTDTWRCVK